MIRVKSPEILVGRLIGLVALVAEITTVLIVAIERIRVISCAFILAAVYLGKGPIVDAVWQNPEIAHLAVGEAISGRHSTTGLPE